MRIAVILALAASILTFFVSCGPHGQSAPAKLSNPQAPAGMATAQGTADSGGGNTFMGKPLESYKVNPRNLEAYKTFIAPWLESQALQGTGIDNALLSILDKKIWYMIPSELKQLSSEKIGSAIGSDLKQAALQDFKQVWMNSLLYDKMESKDQAMLIVHELLMGLRLLKFDSPLVECLSYQTTLEASDPQYCKNNSSDKVRGKPSDLSPTTDYPQIRDAAAMITEKGTKLTPQDLTDILGSDGFIDVPAKQEISLDKLGQMIQETKLMNTWPNYGFDFAKFISDHPDLLSNHDSTPSFTLKSDQACGFDIQIGKESISISLDEKGNKSSYETKWGQTIEMQLSKDDFIGLSLYNVDLGPFKQQENSKKGDIVVDVTLRFLGDTLMGIGLTKEVCLNDDCSDYGQGLNGVHLLCYTRATVTFNQTK